MKFATKLIWGLSAFVIGGLAACKKNELRLTQYDLPADKAYVRFALYSPGTSAVMIRVDGVKINSTNTSGSGGFYPSITNSPDYAAIVPNGNFRLSLPNTGTANDSLLLFSGTVPVQAGKFYSVSLADTGSSRTVFAIEDVLGSLPDSGFVNIRLVNTMARSEAVNLIRVDSTNATTVTRDTIARNIVFGKASTYIRTSISPIAVPSPGTGNYSFLRFKVTTAVSGQTIGAQTLPTTPSPSQRSMTFYAFGFGNGTGVYAPGVSSFIYNQ